MTGASPVEEKSWGSSVAVSLCSGGGEDEKQRNSRLKDRGECRDSRNRSDLLADSLRKAPVLWRALRMLICSVSQAVLDYLVRGFAYFDRGRRCQGNSHVIGCLV